MYVYIYIIWFMSIYIYIYIIEREMHICTYMYYIIACCAYIYIYIYICIYIYIYIYTRAPAAAAAGSSDPWRPRCPAGRLRGPFPFVVLFTCFILKSCLGGCLCGPFPCTARVGACADRCVLYPYLYVICICCVIYCVLLVVCLSWSIASYCVSLQRSFHRGIWLLGIPGRSVHVWKSAPSWIVSHEIVLQPHINQ